MLHNPWIINPSIDMAEVLSQYGRFLPEDYRMAIESMYVPSPFEEDLTPTGKRFVIVGGKDNPTLFSRSIFLCAKLSGAESINVRSTHLDETFMAQNVLEYHAGDIANRTFVPMMDGLSVNDDWCKALENATDIVVFGTNDAMNTYREYESVDRRVWEYGEKFSFGIVRVEDLSMMMINGICFDFVSYYGEGRLAPKFYFVIGEITDKKIIEFNNNMLAIYKLFIEQYRNKLPLTRKSNYTQQYIESNYVSDYVRVGKIGDKDLFDSLYGDVRLIQVDSLDEVNAFIVKYRDSISTVAVNVHDDWDSLDMLDNHMLPRICQVGDMQFPDFFEQYDALDDFNIYVNLDEEY